MLGADLTEILSKHFQVSPLSKDQLDITRAKKIEDILNQFKPTVLVNCAAYTKVDDCERNWDLAKEVNGSAVGELARI